MKARGEKVAMISSWGLTETAPLATAAHFPIDRAGVIGVPLPGVEIKLAPAGDKLEMRVQRPERDAGLLGAARPHRRRRSTRTAGYAPATPRASRIRDDPAKGLVFDGRVAENFKLTHRHLGERRQAARSPRSRRCRRCSRTRW